MSIGYYIQVILSLLILSGVMWAVLKFSKNVQKQKFSGEIKILDRSPLNPTTALVIVELRNQQYLLSVGSQNVQLLEKL